MSETTPETWKGLAGKLDEHVAFMRMNWLNEPEIADDMAAASAYLRDTARLLEETRANWQPIETAPEATWVLVFVPNYGINIATMTRDPNILGPNGAYWFIRGDDETCRPTLWHPIPALDAVPSLEGTTTTNTDTRVDGSPDATAVVPRGRTGEK